MAEELRDEELVVRFGVMAFNDIQRSLQDAMDDPDVKRWELSFFGDKGLDEEGIAEVADRPNPRMRVSTVKRLRGAGFEPYLDEPPEAHIGLRWEEKPADQTLDRLIGLFDEPTPNPHPFR